LLCGGFLTPKGTLMVTFNLLIGKVLLFHWLSHYFFSCRKYGMRIGRELTTVTSLDSITLVTLAFSRILRRISNASSALIFSRLSSHISSPLRLEWPLVVG